MIQSLAIAYVLKKQIDEYMKCCVLSVFSAAVVGGASPLASMALDFINEQFTRLCIRAGLWAYDLSHSEPGTQNPTGPDGLAGSGTPETASQALGGRETVLEVATLRGLGL